MVKYYLNKSINYSFKNQDICNNCQSLLKMFPSYFYIYKMKTYGCFVYDDLSCKPILNLKYNKNPFLAQSIASLMIKTTTINWNNYDYLVPVPMIWYKLFTRGYNQSSLLAHYLSKKTKIPVVRLLTKEDYNSQKNKNYNQRLKQPKFSYKNIIPKNSRLLLIDDVVTSGTTLFSCYELLKDNFFVDSLVFSANKKFMAKSYGNDNDNIMD